MKLSRPTLIAVSYLLVAVSANACSIYRPLTAYPDITDQVDYLISAHIEASQNIALGKDINPTSVTLKVIKTLFVAKEKFPYHTIRHDIRPGTKIDVFLTPSNVGGNENLDAGSAVIAALKIGVGPDGKLFWTTLGGPCLEPTIFYEGSENGNWLKERLAERSARESLE